ncbi:MAG TPA: TonB-dependent siderophore receptor [Candidatus Methylacidiphilales bacterium]
MTLPRPENARLRHGKMMALVNAIMLAGAAAAQAASPSTASPSASSSSSSSSGASSTAGDGQKKKDDASLDEVVVTAKPSGSYQTTESANDKYKGPLRDIAQTVTILPKALLDDQNSSSLKSALQNVPGITFQAGEGGTLAGDNLSIRGYNARSDIFVDGFRDTGVYNRDPFNLDQIEVVKGPASAYSGHGSTGGSVNLISKQASLTPSYGFTTGFGTDQYYRDTLDINQPLGELGEAFKTTAFRLNAMYQYNEYSERNDIYDSRWGIDPTLTWGIGTDTRVTVDYFHLQEYDLPNYGLPVVNALGSATNPGQLVNHVANVPYSAFYGLATRDYEKTYTDIPTLKVSHDFDEIKVENTTRYDRTFRESILTPPRFDSGTQYVWNGAGYTQVPNLPAGDMTEELRARRQIDTLIGNQTEATGKFETGFMKHDWTATAEFSREEEDYKTGNGVNIATPLQAPNSWVPYTFPVNYGVTTKAHMDDFAFSLFDAIKLDPHWIVSGGMRYDHIDQVQVGGNLPRFEAPDDLASWRAALTYKPVESGSFYFGYGTSYNPSIEGSGTNTSSPDGLTAQTSTLEPEKNQTYEFGTKWDVAKNKLSLGAAFFRTIKDNTRVTDPTTNLVQNGGTSRVQGIELSAAGNITEQWKVFGGYTYMESIVLANPFGASALPVGAHLPYVPTQSASLWTTYDLPFHFTIGTGGQFVDKRFGSTANTANVPGYYTQQAMLSYHVNKNITSQINVSNLFDAHFIETYGNGGAVPGAGRSIVFTTTFKY